MTARSSNTKEELAEKIVGQAFMRFRERHNAPGCGVRWRNGDCDRGRRSGRTHSSRECARMIMRPAIVEGPFGFARRAIDQQSRPGVP